MNLPHLPNSPYSPNLPFSSISPYLPLVKGALSSCYLLESLVAREVVKVANKAMQSLAGDFDRFANFAVACAFLDSKESRASDIKGAFTLTVSTAKTMS